MTNNNSEAFATDKDIFDLMASTKQRLTEAVLRDVAKDRGIFYSPHDSRNQLVDKLSLLPFTLPELNDLMEKCERTKRGDKTTSVIIDAVLGADELREVVKDYKEKAGPKETVTSFAKGGTGFVVNVEYDDFDYSRNRLNQRQRLDAKIEFVQKGDKTIIRLPALEKPKQIIEELTNRIEERRKQKLVQEVIELDASFSPLERTLFFTKLMSSLTGFELKTVTNLRVCPSSSPSVGGDVDDDLDMDVEEQAAAKEEMLSIVRSMAMNGENLIASPEYQALRKRGFFITSITWKANRTSTPYDQYLLQAEFENGEEGKDFKYSLKAVYRYQGGAHTKTARTLQDGERESVLGELELAAKAVLNELRSQHTQTAKEAGA